MDRPTVVCFGAWTTENLEFWLVAALLWTNTFDATAAFEAFCCEDFIVVVVVVDDDVVFVDELEPMTRTYWMPLPATLTAFIWPLCASFMRLGGSDTCFCSPDDVWMITFCVTTLDAAAAVFDDLELSGDCGVLSFACFCAVAWDTSSFNLDDVMSPICCAWATVNVRLTPVGVGDEFGVDCAFVANICPALFLEMIRFTWTDDEFGVDVETVGFLVELMRKNLPSAVLMSLIGPFGDGVFDEPAIRICCVLPPGLCITTIWPGTAFVVLTGFGAIFVRLIGTIDFGSNFVSTTSLVGEDNISSWISKRKISQIEFLNGVYVSTELTRSSSDVSCLIIVLSFSVSGMSSMSIMMLSSKSLSTVRWGVTIS